MQQRKCATKKKEGEANEGAEANGHPLLRKNLNDWPYAVNPIMRLKWA